MSSTAIAYKESLELLHKLATKRGFIASTENTTNYRRLWARDGVIAALAALASGDRELIATGVRTLSTLAEYQDETGRIASNISLDGSHVSYGTTVGRIDATLWFVIGACRYLDAGNDSSLLAVLEEPIQKALFYLSCLELNGRGLLYIPPGGDWADEYINHGYVLFDEVLYYIALTLAHARFPKRGFGMRAELLSNLISVNYFPDSKNNDSEYVYNAQLFQRSVKEWQRPLPVAYFSNHSVRYHTDTFAVSMLLHAGLVGDAHAREIRESIIAGSGLGEHIVTQAFYPIINEGDPNWERLRYNFLYTFRNNPNEYHNGGRWSLVHGFFIATFPPEEGKKHLERFAEKLAEDDFAFPEFYHGESGAAMGTRALGFSAAAFVLAHQAIEGGVPIIPISKDL